MTKPKQVVCFLAVGGLLLVVFFVLMRKPAPSPASAPASGSNSPAPAAASRTSAPSAAPVVPPGEAAKPFLPAVNQWLAAARPCGLDRSLTPDDIRAVQTNRNGRIITVWTAAHRFEFHGDRLRLFQDMNECSFSRRNPRGRESWTQSPAPWTKDEATAEALAIMRRLGNNYTPPAVEHRDLSQPTERGVRPAPFHKLVFLDTNNTPIFSAEFRMEAAGPGRLTYWFDSTH